MRHTGSHDRVVPLLVQSVELGQDEMPLHEGGTEQRPACEDSDVDADEHTSDVVRRLVVQEAVEA